MVQQPGGKPHARPEAQDRLREERSSEKVKRPAEQLEDEDPQQQGYRTPEGKPMRQPTSPEGHTPLTGEVHLKGMATELVPPLFYCMQLERLQASAPKKSIQGSVHRGFKLPLMRTGAGSNAEVVREMKEYVEQRSGEQLEKWKMLRKRMPL